MNTRQQGIGIAVITAVISGVAIFVNGNGVRAFGDASAYTTAKNVVAAAIIVAFAAALRSGADRARAPKRASQWWGLAAVAVIGGAVPFVLFFEGLARASSNQASVVHKSLVVWVAILAVVILREKLTWLHYVAVGGIFAAQVSLAGGFGGFAALFADPGFLMIGAATLMWSVEVVVAKRLLRELAPETVSIARMAGGALLLIGWGLVRGNAGAVVPTTATQWGWVALTGLLLAAYVLTWHHALKLAKAVDVTAVLVLGVLVTAALNAGLRGADLAAGLPWYLAILACGGALVWQSRTPRPIEA